MIISAKNLGRVFGAGKAKALDGVTLDVARGEYLVVTGPSGSGKSTLLHLLCGIDCPTSGHVLFGGQGPFSPAQWRGLRARRIGLVFQSFHLLPGLTARENVEVAMFGVTARAADRRRRADELLDRVGLSRQARQRPGQLSGGECQRLAIARAVGNSPDLILADEPTGNLDTGASAQVLGLLEQLRAERGATLVIVTHDPSIAARAERTVALLDGRVQSDWRRED